MPDPKVYTILLPEEGNASYHYRMDMEEKERELADARNAALEEAAKACETLAKDRGGDKMWDDGFNAGAEACVEAIRALKTP